MKGKHIHIVGSSPRSGTTLLAELFRTSFNIDGFYEYEKSIFKSEPWHYSILVSKAPTETIYFPWLLNINPNLWCVYILRDPRDAANNYLSNLRIWNTYYKSAKRSFNHPRFITVKYEDLVNNPDRTQQLFMSQLPFLEISSSFSDFGFNTGVSELAQASLNNVRPINNKSVGKWKDNPGRVKSQIQLHGNISATLIDLGYEKDNSWEAIIDDAEAEPPTAGEINFLSWHKKLRMKYRVIRKLIYYIFICLKK